jgi:hypothetical protein
MQKHVYEYAVIRVVPRVEREEFLNVGIIVFCKFTRYIKVLYKLDTARLQSFSADLDAEQLERNLVSFEKISRGARDGGPIAQEAVPERFRWLTAVRSSVIQTSRPHPGLSSDLEKTAEALFRDLVL